MRKLILFATLALCACSSPQKQTSIVSPEKGDQPYLDVVTKDEVRTFSIQSLLASPELKEITVERDPAYGHTKKTYLAVPTSSLFKGVTVDSKSDLIFVCRDGFSGPISSERLFNKDPNKAVAYIAIENPKNKWRPLKPSAPDKTPGPFYLIWENPEKSKISQEEWPFQLSSFKVVPSAEKQFPAVLPSPKLSENSSVKKGYRSFLQNCFACHTMNGEGTSQMGPDLNIPMNPTEYFKTGVIEKLVRNNQKVRHWPDAKMSHFDKSVISDDDLKNIVAYLKHMATRKPQLPQKK